MGREDIREEVEVLRTQQGLVPRAKGGGNYGSKRMWVVRNTIEGAIWCCPRSEKVLQYRLQLAWRYADDLVKREDAAREREHQMRLACMEG